MAYSTRHVAIVVLGAGSSIRLGSRKQLLEIEGEPMLRRAVKTALASQASLVCATVPADNSAVVATLEGLEALIIEITNPELGQSESIRAGLAAVEQSDCQAILFMPCDLPLLNSAHLDSLIEKYQAGDFQIVASRYDNIVGTPLLLDRALWQELDTLRGDTGARKIIAAHQDKTVAIDWEGGKFDIATQEDAQRFLRGN